jgi:CubicO group peptidase (beta-lactamase class C family)
MPVVMNAHDFVSARIRDGENRSDTDGGAQPLVPWWSVTKTVLAAGALKLVADGRLSLDERLDGRPYTLRQLLQHRAGVPEYGRLAAYHDAVDRGDPPWSVDDLLQRVGAGSLDFAPGQGWAYSNVGYLLVRQIIEGVLGTDIGTALSETLLAPLGLDTVKLARHPADLTDTAWGNARGYHPDWVYHGLLIGTADDAARFLHDLITGKILPPDLLTEMTDAHPLGGPLPGRPWLTTGYGLGLMIGRMAGAGLAIGHSGSGPGSVGAVYHFPEGPDPCTVAVFAVGDDEAVTEFEVARLADGGDPPDPRP